MQVKYFVVEELVSKLGSPNTFTVVSTDRKRLRLRYANLILRHQETANNYFIQARTLSILTRLRQGYSK